VRDDDRAVLVPHVLVNGALIFDGAEQFPHRLGDMAGDDRVTLHELRHAVASRLIHAGLDPVTVAGVQGHKDATTTLRLYGHQYDRERTDERVRDAIVRGGGS
jgi:integrase